MNISDNRTARKETHPGRSLGERLGRMAFRFSRAYQASAEFLTRQAGFDFAIVTDAVLTIAASTKKTLWSNFKKWLTAFRSEPETKKPEQLRLDLLTWLRLSNTA